MLWLLDSCLPWLSHCWYPESSQPQSPWVEEWWPQLEVISEQAARPLRDCLPVSQGWKTTPDGHIPGINGRWLSLEKRCEPAGSVFGSGIRPACWECAWPLVLSSAKEWWVLRDSFEPEFTSTNALHCSIACLTLERNLTPAHCCKHKERGSSDHRKRVGVWAR